MKPEIRNPKSERNPKAETRQPIAKAAAKERKEGIQWRFLCEFCAFLRRFWSFEISSRNGDSSTVISDFGFRPSFGLRVSTFGFPSFCRAFTLIELLIVIAIISILAGMVIPIAGAVNRNKIRAKARVELEQVATAIDLYKAKLGHYPPDNPGNPGINQLYYELLGTTFTNGTYTTLDGSASINVSSLPNAFGLNALGANNVGGFINCTQASGGEEGRVASSFLPGLKPGQIGLITNNNVLVKLLVSSILAPGLKLNPIYYVSSSPTNNPNSYDLWLNVVISGKTNRLSNWNKEIITP